MTHQMFMGKNKPQVRLLEVGSDDAGQRIDNFLFSRLKGVPKCRVYRLLRKGEVRVNKGRIRAHYRLQTGDVIRIPPLQSDPQAPVMAVSEKLSKYLATRILYEDAGLLVLNKPAGMAVHGGSGLQGGVIECLRKMRPKEKTLELVHRLDKETSGCLLIARKKQVLRQLHQMFRGDDIDKRYLTLLSGRWHERFKRMDAPLRKYVQRGGERFVKVDGSGKASVTEFRRLEVFSNATLVEARLLTGRTHQVRVHAAHLGHPIAGDGRYGDEEVNRDWRRHGLKRLFLHAWRLAFIHPVTGAELQLEAPLEPELLALLTRLKTT